jgi:uncharacterized protein (TIGR02147 family)
MQAMKNVFDYTDFRKYLEDYYCAKKADNPSFSYGYITSKSGFNNKGFIYNIFSGKKKLSRANCLKLSRALDHSKAEADYFENLVSFNQAGSHAEKTLFFERMGQIAPRGKGLTKTQLLRKDQYEYYSNWYHGVVRLLVDDYGFKNDYAWLARMVCPAISVKQARRSVALLKRLGLIVRSKNGVWRAAHKSITTGREAMGLAVQDFHLASADLAKKAILNETHEKRNVSNLTLSISEDTYTVICDEVYRFQEKIMDIANNDSKADRVYHLNFQFFPVSKSDPERKSIT